MRDEGRRGLLPDLGVVLLFLAAAVLVLQGLWAHPNAVNPSANDSDPPFFQWALIHATRIFTHGEHPFASPLLNSPYGVNLMGNTALLGLTVPLVPVTLLFGPAVALVVLTTLALAGTAAAWYFVLSRHVVNGRPAAAVGGAFAGFAPGMINHANGHPNLIAQFLLPFIVWQALALARSTRPVRDGVVLGLLVTWQAFINEELLFLAALATAVFVAAYAAFRPAEVAAGLRPFLRGAWVAVLVAGVLLAYPLWYQFAGPQHYRGVPDFIQGYGADLASFPAFAKLSLVGQSPADANLAPTPEENTFLGWPLLLALAVIVVLLWRRVSVRSLAVVGVVFGVLSLGGTVKVRGHGLFTGPWGWLNKLALFQDVVPGRIALMVIPVGAVLLAYAVDALAERPSLVVRYAGLAAVAVALIPVVPRELPVHPRAAVPRFIASGDWRRYLPEDRALLSADVSWGGQITTMAWDNATGDGYRVVGGYFLGPDPAGHGTYGPNLRPTAALLSDIAYNGGTRPIGDEQRAAARDDVRFWQAGLIVLADGAPNGDDLRAALDQLFGTGQRVDDVWLWQVSALA